MTQPQAKNQTKKLTLSAVADAWLRRHPKAMLIATIALTIGAAVALLFVGHSEPILYQAF